MDYVRVLRLLGIFVAALAVGAAVVGYLVSGRPGLIGGLLGAGIVGLFFGTSALMMHLGRKGGPDAQARNLLVSWFIKLIVLLGLLLVLNGATFVSRVVLGVTILVGVVGSLALETRLVLAARIAPGDL
jgi:heme/copper-type cytochrome/quinol oxidase subunit 4